MIPLEYKQAAATLGAECGLEGRFDSVSTDTRKVCSGSLFIALKGENFDGHSFAAKALENGSGAVVVERDCGLGDRQILVADTHDALLKLAGWYRSFFDIPVIGITGSVGKTTTKDMTALVMGSKYNTLKNEGNLNNEIGVPLTLFRLEKEHGAAVIEMGMSGFGEISRMTAAVRPDLAIISNIGVSHIEKLGSRQGILKAKLEILEGMKDGAPVILNGDDDMLANAPTGSHPVTYFGIDNPLCAYKAQDITSIDDETVFAFGFSGGPDRVCLPFKGRHNIYNSLAAVAAGEFFGVDPRDGFEALKGFTASGMRQKTVKRNGIIFIEDCYNASPDSQAAALSVLGKTECGRKIAVLGDMLELGKFSEQMHRLVGGYAAENGVDILYTYGEQSLYTAQTAAEKGVKDIRSFTDKHELTADLAGELKENDAVLFKASRGMKLEEIICKIYEYLDTLN